MSKASVSFLLNHPDICDVPCGSVSCTSSPSSEGRTEHSLERIFHYSERTHEKLRCQFNKVIGLSPAFRFRAHRVRLSACCLPGQLQYILSTEPHCCIVRRLSQRENLEGYALRCILLAFHLIIATGQRPHFWTQEAERRARDICRQFSESYSVNHGILIHLTLASICSKYSTDKVRECFEGTVSRLQGL